LREKENPVHFRIDKHQTLVSTVTSLPTGKLSGWDITHSEGTGLVDLRTEIISGRSGSGASGRNTVVGADQDGPQDRVVEFGRTLEGGELQPDKEDSLEGEVPGEIVEDEAKREALQESEEAVNSPVRQPLSIILVLGCLEGLERQVGGERPADKVGNRDGERVDEDKEGKDGHGSDNGIRLGDLGLLLKGVERRVLGELLIELGDVEVGAFLGLNNGGVSLDLLRRRHL